MPKKDRVVKRLARERMRATGEPYTQARQAVVAQQRREPLKWDPLMATVPFDEDLYCRLLGPS